MKALLKDIGGFLSTLTGIDILLYCAVLFLILLVVCLAYIIKNTDDEEEPESNELDLAKVVKTLEQEQEVPIVNHTSYEKEQEEKAIISYDELLAQSKNKNNYNYDEEIITNDDDLKIKKIDLTKKIVLPELPKDKEENSNPIMFKYQEEEEFLKTLKLFIQEL